MTRRMRVVTPFRPFAPESREHMELGPFDWLAAIAMLRASVRRASGCETVTITDVDTSVPGPRFAYVTEERRLMLWILEVALRYLESADFDCDTVMLSPDSLNYGDLTPWFAGDFGIVVRPDHSARPILNAIQWWPVASRDRIVALYRKARVIARGLPDDLLIWGADSEPFRQLLDPVRGGLAWRRGLLVNLVDSREVMQPLTSDVIGALKRGTTVEAKLPVVDFRYTRKRYMRQFFEATIGGAS